MSKLNYKNSTIAIKHFNLAGIKRFEIYKRDKDVENQEYWKYQRTVEWSEEEYDIIWYLLKALGKIE